MFRRCHSFPAKKGQVNTIQLYKVLRENGSKKYAIYNCNLHKIHSVSSFPDEVNKNDTLKLILSFSEIASVTVGKD